MERMGLGGGSDPGSRVVGVVGPGELAGCTIGRVGAKKAEVGKPRTMLFVQPGKELL